MKSLLLVFFILTFSFSQNQKDSIAFKGYDLVNYFTQNSAQIGKQDISVTHNKLTYLFISQNNADLFQTTPSKFLPEYDGYCAYGVAKNGKYPINPKTFSLQNGKLYFFYDNTDSGGTYNSRNFWNKKKKGLKVTADKNWNGLQKK